MTRSGTGPVAPEVIYEAMLDDEALAALPSTLAAAVGARSAHLFWQHSSGGAEIMSHSGYHTDAHYADYLANYASQDPWTRSGLPIERQNRAWNCDDLVPETQYRQTPFYNDFIRGMGDDTFRCLGSILTTSDGLGAIGLHRGRGSARYDDGEVKVLAAMMPALSRMLGVRARLHSARRIQAERTALLDAVPLCVIAITADGRLAYANEAGEAALAAGQALKLHGGRIVAAGEGGALRTAIARATDRVCPAASTVPLSAGMVATVIPHLSPSGQRQALLLAAPPAAPTATEAVLRSGFGLTAAEAAVAVMLARGLDLREIAEQRGSAYATVRTQLRSIAGKTGCSRQSQIAAAVARIIGA